MNKLYSTRCKATELVIQGKLVLSDLLIIMIRNLWLINLFGTQATHWSNSLPRLEQMPCISRFGYLVTLCVHLMRDSRICTVPKEKNIK